MAVVVLNFCKKGANERSIAKANIKYIAHRPGKTAEHAQPGHGHSGNYCCGTFEKLVVERELPINRNDPRYFMFHSRHCDIFDPGRYDFDWYGRPKKTVPQNMQAGKEQGSSTDKTGSAGGRGKERATQENEHMNRTLFTAQGDITRHEAYALVNNAAPGSTFFRIKICPDPKSEDNPRDLLLREITRQTMAIAEQTGHPVSWVAAIHDDHTDKRHVHVLAVTKAARLPAPAMIKEASKACCDQKLALDREREQEEPTREQEAEEWERER